MIYPELCKGVMENEPGCNTDAIALQGLGLVNPNNFYKFYNELHSYLASAGVDGGESGRTMYIGDSWYWKWRQS